MTEERYPVKETKYPTLLDDLIAAQTKWLKENNHPLWEEAQRAPSEISFKNYILRFLKAGYGDEIQQFVEGKTDELPSPYTVGNELWSHPDVSLADLEWNYKLARAENSPSAKWWEKISTSSKRNTA